MTKTIYEVVTNSQLNSNETFTETEIRLAVEVMELLYRWKKELENADEYDKEAA